MTAPGSDTVPCRVVGPFQINVNGVVYPSGAELDVPADLAVRWASNGWVEPSASVAPTGASVIAPADPPGGPTTRNVGTVTATAPARGNG